MYDSRTRVGNIKAKPRGYCDAESKGERGSNYGREKG